MFKSMFFDSVLVPCLHFAVACSRTSDKGCASNAVAGE